MTQVTRQQAFQTLIESQTKDGYSSYIDAITDYMQENELEAKQVSKLISPNLQEKIREEAVRNNTISDTESGSKLPL
jgi:hypothetical protein|tara:strand:- start:2720 stop:2950 length:231 start_codon:yes stop_codon:yes gene_type:complete